MVGDVDGAMARNAEEFRALGIRPARSGIAVDLGAGIGLHAIPLAQLGFSVLAIDGCISLAEELKRRAAPFDIRTITGDLLDFRNELDAEPEIICCMGDTLTHLPDLDTVRSLFSNVALSMPSHGTFVTTFRDYAADTAVGLHRFIPVRSDADRILTCFLEYADDAVEVYDLLNRREGEHWKLEASSYRKLRIAPAWVVDILTGLGFVVVHDKTANGMTRIVARRTGA
ncbi:MAG TPA: methyltransferase domain-containing protein [Paucimonas sp.]|nr:methyltransferase domain-containing protein [Paucimonas sp.]